MTDHRVRNIHDVMAVWGVTHPLMRLRVHAGLPPRPLRIPHQARGTPISPALTSACLSSLGSPAPCTASSPRGTIRQAQFLHVNAAQSSCNVWVTRGPVAFVLYSAAVVFLYHGHQLEAGNGQPCSAKPREIYSDTGEWRENCLAACGCKARVSCHKHAGLMIPGRAASFWRCWMLLCRTGRCIGAECCVSSHGVWDHCAGVDQAEAGSDVGPQRHLHGRNRLPVPGPPGHCRALRGWAACR